MTGAVGVWEAVARLVEVADDLRDRADLWTPIPVERRYLRSIAAEVDEACALLTATAPDPPGDAQEAAGDSSQVTATGSHTPGRSDCSCDRPGRCPRYDR